MSQSGSSHGAGSADSSNSIGDSSSLKGVFVKEPLKSDILFGRGNKPQKHPGNRRMRRIIDKHALLFHSQPKEGKKKIAQQVYDEVMKGGPRFLKRVDDQPHAWIVVDNITAMGKINHALRCRKNANRLISKSRGDFYRFPVPTETSVPHPPRFSDESDASVVARAPMLAALNGGRVDEQLSTAGVSSRSSADPATVAQAVSARETRADLERNLELTGYGLGILPNPRTMVISPHQSQVDYLLQRNREMENIAILQLLSRNPCLNLFPPFWIQFGLRGICVINSCFTAFKLKIFTSAMDLSQRATLQQGE